MLSTRLVRAAAAARPAPTARLFSTFPALRSARIPSLGDIQPDQQETFNTRQKKFREQLVEAQKQREASGFASSSPSSSTAPYSPNAPQGLGSLSTAPRATGTAAQAAQQEPERKGGIMSNLLYGTKEGRELDAQIEASFSQVLARGKYVHQIEFHTVKPDCVDEYVGLVGHWYPKIANSPETKVHLVGSWRTEVGDCDTFGKHCRITASLNSKEANAITQSTSGSTNATTASTPPSTPSRNFPTTPKSTASSANSSPAAAPP